jgi:quercetin dioxygenase-like cupin family protein
MGRQLTLNPGDLCHLPPDETHAVHAIENSSVLLTLINTHANPSRHFGETP